MYDQTAQHLDNNLQGRSRYRFTLEKYAYNVYCSWLGCCCCGDGSSGGGGGGGGNSSNSSSSSSGSNRSSSTLLLELGFLGLICSCLFHVYVLCFV
jgi:hypothetical protein